jgi:hypothetical protein
MNTLNRRGFLVATASLSALVVARTARATPLDDALARVARARAPLTTLTGPFTQERTIGLLATKVRSTGTLTLVRPDRLRWELAPPDDVVYWIAPEGIAFRGKSGTERARAGAVPPRIASSLDDLRTLLGGDLARLTARYEIRLDDGGPDPVFDATPRDPKAPIQRLRFALAREGALPRFAEIIEGPRDATRIDFGALRVNTPVEPALMRPPS